MKKYFILLAIIFPSMLQAQSVSINTDGSQPDNTAILDIKSNSKGLLIPRLTTAERTGIVSPAIGLTVFDTDTYSNWIFRGDVMGNWVESLHSLDKHWNRTGINIFTTNTGNVGIGTSSPAEKLTINATDPAIKFLNAGTEKGFVQASGNDMKIGTYLANTTGDLVFNTKGVDRMFIKPDGNIGIGTDDPTEKLTINAINPSIKLVQSNTQKGYLKLEASNVSLGTFSTNTTGRIEFSTKDVERMTITPDGFFGIGTQSPVSKFQITGGDEASISTHGHIMFGNQNGANLVIDNNEILARNNGSYANLSLQDGGGNVYIGDPSNFTSAHRLGVDGNAVITGNMRIGTAVTPSGYKLAVDGEMICTEVLVRLVPNWPDYVFGRNYKLPDLNEVENFIKVNNHLPGIPSAKTIETNGMSIGEMQKMQMEKIEELTLYIIDLKKDIEKLKAKL